MMRNLAALLAMLGILGCSEPRAPTTVPENAEPGDLNLEPCTYETDAGEYHADCGTLVVRENRGDPGTRLIALPFIRVHASGGSPGEPIFWLAGGPGASNLAFSRLEGLIDNHDIVMVGYRGVDGSVVLDCPEVTEVFKHPPADLLDESSLDSLAAAYARCAERLQSEGVDTDGYTVTEVASDIEDARVALRYGEINLLSQSYGTRLAMLYAWMYPETAHRSAMISVNPPGHFVWQPEVIDRQIEYYSGLCEKDPECSSRTDDLARSMRKVAGEMPDRWLFLPIKRGTVLAGTFALLYHTGTAPVVFDAWLAAEKGDSSGFALLTLAGDFMFPSAAVWGDSLAKATSADDLYEPGRDCLTEMMPPDSIIGSPMSLLGCAAAGWPTKRIPADLRRVQPSDVETLLVSGNVDFSTPAEAATAELLPYLSNGKQVVLSEFGHTGDVWGLQPEATVRMLTSFFDTGVADDSLFIYEPMDFHVGLGLPGMAKIGLGIMALVLLGLLALAWFIVRRVRRRRRAQAGAS